MLPGVIERKWGKIMVAKQQVRTCPGASKETKSLKVQSRSGRIFWGFCRCIWGGLVPIISQRERGPSECFCRGAGEKTAVGV